MAMNAVANQLQGTQTAAANPSLVGAGGQLNPDQQAALQAMVNKNQLQAHYKALQAVVDKGFKADAEKHVQEVGLGKASEDLLTLQNILGAAPGQAPGQSQSQSSPVQDLGKIAIDKGMPAAPGEAAPAPEANVDPRATQSPEVLANNEQLRKDAYSILHPTSFLGKLAANLGMGQEWQKNQLSNLGKALEIGGGDPQGQYYKAYSGTLQQVMAGDKPLDTEKLAELVAGQRAAGLKAISDGQTALNDALKGTIQVIDVASKNKSLTENIGALGGATDRMKEGYKTVQSILDRLKDLNDLTRNLQANPIQFNKKGAAEKPQSALPGKSDFSSTEEAMSAGVKPGTIVTINGKKYKAQ